MNLDLKSMVSSVPQLALIFARQVLNEESDMTGDDDVLQDASRFV